MGIAIAIIVWLLLCALVDKFATSKGRSGFFLISFLVSPLVGFLIALLISPDERKQAEVAGVKHCPQCAETVKEEAKVCRFCGFKFVQFVASQPSNRDPLGIYKRR